LGEAEFHLSGSMNLMMIVMNEDGVSVEVSSLTPES